jgi:hypothetical protein
VCFYFRNDKNTKKEGGPIKKVGPLKKVCGVAKNIFFLHQKVFFVFFVYQTLSVRKLSVRTMEQGNVTPEHIFQEVEMFHSPDNTLLRDGQDAPPTKRQRGLGLSWIVTSRVQIVDDQGGLIQCSI